MYSSRGGQAHIFDLVRKMPPEIVEETRRRFGAVRLTLLWLHSFEEPFYNADELESLAAASRFGRGETHFVGALCCLDVEKPADVPV